MSRTDFATKVVELDSNGMNNLFSGYSEMTAIGVEFVNLLILALQKIIENPVIVELESIEIS